jgi:pyruvate dehydrogenase E2 component (dihydrolipoamide acetyltransferase)
MSVSVSMPQLGESVTEGTVTRWLKKEGERVEADEPLLEVSTDKVDTEIPSPVAGILRGITVAEDETVAVGAELAVIDENGAAAPAADEGGAEAQAQAEPAAPAESPADGSSGGQEPDGSSGSQEPDGSSGGQEPDVQPAAEPGYPYPASGGYRVARTSRPPCTSGRPPTRRSATGRRARRTPRVSRSRRPPRRQRTRASRAAPRSSRPRPAERP